MLHIGSDLLITLSYFFISGMIFYFVHKKEEVQYKSLFFLFAGFIGACGATHLMGIITLWVPLYYVQGIVLAVTALVSVSAAWYLWPLLPQLLALPSGAQLLREIQERKHTEAAFRQTNRELEELLICYRESEARFRMMADSAPVLIWISGTDKLCTYFNRKWLEFTGRTMDQEIGNGWADGVHPDDLARCLETYITTFDARQPFCMEYRLRRHDGEYRWVMDAGVPRYEGKEFLGYIGSCVDITERKQVEEALKESEQRLKLALDAGEMGVWDLDLRSDHAWRSALHDRIFGYESLQPAWGYGVFLNHVVLEEREFVKQQFERAYTTGDLDFECRILRTDQSLRWIAAKGEVVKRNEQGQPVQMMGVVMDITERKRTDESLRLAASVYEASSEGMLVTDTDNHIINVNPAFTSITGYTLADVIGKNPKILSSGRQDEAFYQAMWHSIETKGHWQGEIWNRKKNGEIYAEWLNINVIRNEKGAAQNYIALFSDITEKKRTDELIWRQANFDPLTQLPNRRLFRDRLEQEIKKATRTGSSVALLFIDLDHFKEINDTFGHGVGDLLLVEAANRIRDCVRESDTVARLGGDEFTVILSDLTDISAIEKISRNILGKLGEPIGLAGALIYVSASIGITLYPADASELDDLIKNADRAMYVAKNEGRNRFSYFTRSTQQTAQARLRLIDDLRGAVSHAQFEVYFQPIVELSTGRIIKAEALLRWQHPERGFISPAEFIPLAEETGLINEISDWVFKESISYAKHWSGQIGQTFQVSVNTSSTQFLAKADCAEWPNYLRELGMPGDSIAVEITEGLLVNATPLVVEKLLQFRDAGMHVAIDDFGSGISSLLHLKKCDIDFLKIDRSFIGNLSTDSNHRVLTDGIIAMAHKLGLQVIAEGVETEAQRNFLVDAGCDYAQGYLYAEPMPAKEFEKTFRVPFSTTMPNPGARSTNH